MARYAKFEKIYEKSFQNIKLYFMNQGNANAKEFQKAMNYIYEKNGEKYPVYIEFDKIIKLEDMLIAMRALTPKENEKWPPLKFTIENLDDESIFHQREIKVYEPFKKEAKEMDKKLLKMLNESGKKLNEFKASIP